MKMRSLSVVGLCFLLMGGMSWKVGAFSEEDLTKLKATGSCVQCNRSGADLTGMELLMANLTGANLTGANLTLANLFGANLTGTIFCKTTMPDGIKKQFRLLEDKFQ